MKNLFSKSFKKQQADRILGYGTEKASWLLEHFENNGCDYIDLKYLKKQLEDKEND